MSAYCTGFSEGLFIIRAIVLFFCSRQQNWISKHVLLTQPVFYSLQISIISFGFSQPLLPVTTWKGMQVKYSSEFSLKSWANSCVKILKKVWFWFKDGAILQVGLQFWRNMWGTGVQSGLFVMSTPGSTCTFKANQMPQRWTLVSLSGTKCYSPLSSSPQPTSLC